MMAPFDLDKFLPENVFFDFKKVEQAVQWDRIGTVFCSYCSHNPAPAFPRIHNWVSAPIKTILVLINRESFVKQDAQLL